MSQASLLVTKFSQHPLIPYLKEWYSKNNGTLNIKGLSGSAVSLLATSLKDESPHFIIVSEKEDAAYLYHDISQLIGEQFVFFLPSSYKRSPEFGQPDSTQAILRTEALQNLRIAKPGQFYISFPDALMEKVPEVKTIDSQTISIRCNEKTDLTFIVDFLKELGFKRVDFVYEPGQFSVRGSILDVFSFSFEEPFRIDFFGDQIESIRSFDIETQLSKISYDEISIIPDLMLTEEEGLIPLPDFIPPNVRIWMDAPAVIEARMDLIFKKIESSDSIEEDDIRIPRCSQLINGQLFSDLIQNRPVVIWGNAQGCNINENIEFNTAPQPIFHKHFSLLEENIIERQNEGYSVFVLSGSQRQLERLRQIFTDKESNLKYEEVNHALHEGFVDHDLKWCIYTDHQIFDRYHKFTLRTDQAKAARQSISIKELTRLNPGDYVVHIDHGVGRFGGLVTTDVNGKKQEAIRLVYRDNDVLLVSIHSLHRISKFKGQEGEPPRINKLGSGTWQKLKDKTKKKVKDIARELIGLYARRRSEPGFAFSSDSFLQKELEASFMYEDTPDQYKATIAVKSDMEESIPMDRLVCGDVGFGKTEIAIRAAFKAVTDNKQVALLVPTTILALQHFRTFNDRLKDFPCRVEYVSRLRKPAEVKKTLEDLKKGKVDILIGTHRLVGKDVVFKDLGLLIIDEEQRFGVSVKEKLKNLKVNVDSLTLTATPIPRTLQFSLMGARDLSILNTPPPNRHPIITELHTFNEEIIKEAILYEVERNGQVFFINNRVHNILEIEALVRRILPSVKTVVAHGQMEGQKLESIMLNFIEGDNDVLIATTIIESGLDIPNANTIIINNAHQFGLSELHQLRGRVGRSNKKAFCYLLAPPITTLTSDARKRLKILEEFSELGSGFNIAMQDLDIRGAGNILGAEQSGYIADIGYETYQRILQEALLELREDEYPELISKKTQSDSLPAFSYITDCQIETDSEVRFPESYVNNITERMDLYRDLDNIPTYEQLEEFRRNLIDRFGEPPYQAEGLLDIVKIRIIAGSMGVEKLFYKNNIIRIYFISNSESPFFKSEIFGNILKWLQANSKKAKMEEKKGKLMLTIPSVQNLSTVMKLMEEMRDFNG